MRRTVHSPLPVSYNHAAHVRSHPLISIFGALTLRSSNHRSNCVQRLGNLMFECLMLPLQFRKLGFHSHIVHRFVSSRARARRTSDRGIPNSRAIRDGVMPALNADRTAFTRPRVNETSATFNFAVLVGGDCILVKSARAGMALSTLFGVLPRRFISSSVAACIKSNSRSLKCWTALRRFLGSTYSRGSLSVDAFGGGDAEAVAVGNRSGAVRSAESRPMASACREQHRSAISSERLCTPSSIRRWCPSNRF